MEDRTSSQTPMLRESARLGVLYLFLTTLFFGLVTYFLGGGFRTPGADGFVSQSGVISFVSGIVSYTLMSIAVWHLRGRRMGYNIIVCFAISAVTAVVEFMVNMQVYQTFYDLPASRYLLENNVAVLFMCWAVYFGWSSTFLTLLYHFEIQDRERKLAVVREEALSAQMRALRYQVNPHFLFNTLNSIVGLIEEGSATRAERMAISLSDFLHTTLTLDPFHDVPLGEELMLQQQYLQIEHERFSDRMSFHLDMPDDVRHALLPSLILQPLIENAVKHGVGAMTGKVRISLFARRVSDRLRVIVENDMPTGPQGSKPVGMGVGLRNVAERLRARFHDEGQFFAGPAAPGTFRAVVDVPWCTATPAE